MSVIEAQRASILVPHDHLHINQKSASDPVQPSSGGGFKAMIPGW